MLFLAYKLSTLTKAHVSYVGNPKLMNNVMAQIELSIPCDRNEQTQIAAILATIDAAIEQTEAIIAKQQRIKTGLMHDLLTRGIDAQGNIRSEATHRFKDSPLGRIPVEWEVEYVGNILKKYGGHIQTGPFGSQLHSYEYVNEGIPTVMPQDIISNTILTTNIAKITEEKANQLLRHRMKKDDVIFARRGDLSRCALIGEREVGWLCGTGCLLLKPPTNTLTSQWLKNVYSYHYTQRQINILAVGSVMVNLNTSILSNTLIPLPEVEEQHRIEHCLLSINESINASINTLNKLELLKKGLMQDLLTGNVRVTPIISAHSVE